MNQVISSCYKLKQDPQTNSPELVCPHYDARIEKVFSHLLWGDDSSLFEFRFLRGTTHSCVLGIRNTQNYNILDSLERQRKLSLSEATRDATERSSVYF